jgi:hypothetical protein
LKPKNEVSDAEYEDFYRFTAKAWDKPRYTMHFTADAPLDIHALLFLPEENQERFGFGAIQPGVALYCKRVLIDPNPEGLLPEWLRFVRGVIDSADLPLNISRESMQDSALMRRIKAVLTRRVIRFLDAEAFREHVSGPVQRAFGGALGAVVIDGVVAQRGVELLADGVGVGGGDGAQSADAVAGCQRALCVEQAAQLKAARAGVRVMGYRNIVKSLPWFSTVREKMDDPMYNHWFIPFDVHNKTPFHVPPCDTNYAPPKCSKLYHDIEQTPGVFPHGDGHCPGPCDCGVHPCGEYLYDVRFAR